MFEILPIITSEDTNPLIELLAIGVTIANIFNDENTASELGQE